MTTLCCGNVIKSRSFAALRMTIFALDHLKSKSHMHSGELGRLPVELVSLVARNQQQDQPQADHDGGATHDFQHRYHRVRLISSGEHGEEDGEAGAEKADRREGDGYWFAARN